MSTVFSNKFGATGRDRDVCQILFQNFSKKLEVCFHVSCGFLQFPVQLCLLQGSGGGGGRSTTGWEGVSHIQSHEGNWRTGDSGNLCDGSPTGRHTGWILVVESWRSIKEHNVRYQAESELFLAEWWSFHSKRFTENSAFLCFLAPI